MAKTKTTTKTRNSPFLGSPEKLFFRIGEVARLLGVNPSVLRYWETEFPTVAPRKSATNHRVYRRAEVEALRAIKHLLYHEKYSIEGARKRLAASRHALEPCRAGQNTRKLSELLALTQELRQLAGTPISRLFRF